MQNFIKLHQAACAVMALCISVGAAAQVPSPLPPPMTSLATPPNMASSASPAGASAELSLPDPTVGGKLRQHITLKEAAQVAALKSPEVLARWHAFLEAAEEVGVARGQFLPKLDFSVASGKQKTVQKRVNIDDNYNGQESLLTLRQMLFDGFATSSEIKRLGRAKLVRYFELLDASENVALEAGRAYLDVVRFRYQVFLAEENYIQHHAAFEQLKQRADSGVGKRVDVEQAGSRLALADVNLTTAYANLHDVSARYMRIVGEPPATVMYPPAQLSKALPNTADGAISIALKHNPALRAAIENIEAAQYDLDVRRSAFMPKVDLIARQEAFSNYQDDGKRTDNRVEVRMFYNLFNGGSDVARTGQYRERKNIALDQREKACRDMRQTLAIAFNETVRLNDQLSFIGLQVNLVEKTRTAYRDQFNIGQRTLLDLLNTQNEYFDARRSQVNAETDLSLAYLRSYASMGRLLETLGLKQIDPDNTPDVDSLTPVELAQLCPPVAPIGTTLDREALGRKTKELMEGSSNSFIGGRTSTATPVFEASVQVTGDPALNQTMDAAETEVSGRITAWGAAWAAREAKNYLAFYAPEFKPEGGLSRAAWARQREQRIAKATSIRVDIQNLVVKSAGPDVIVAEFRQVYATDTYGDTSDKTIEWRKQNGQWLIVREVSRTLAQGL